MLKLLAEVQSVCPVLLHIYGPFSINMYGVSIVIGLLCFFYLALNDPRRSQLISEDQAVSLLSLNIIFGLIGGRLLHVLSDTAAYQSLYEMLAVWDGGFSLLGTLLSITLLNPIYLKMHKIPVLKSLDIAGTYLPLTQLFGRIGCFFAGCCYGLQTTLPWGITYTHTLSLAPLGLTLHPTQLYAALLHGIAFFVLKKLSFKKLHPGTIFGLYLIGASTIRFSVDFLRDNRTEFAGIPSLSLEQILACMLFIIGLLFICYTTFKRGNNS